MIGSNRINGIGKNEMLFNLNDTKCCQLLDAFSTQISLNNVLCEKAEIPNHNEEALLNNYQV